MKIRAGGGRFRAGGGNFRAAGCSPLLFLFMGNTNCAIIKFYSILLQDFRSAQQTNNFLILQQNICCGLVGTQKNRLNEILLSNQNIYAKNYG